MKNKKQQPYRGVEIGKYWQGRTLLSVAITATTKEPLSNT
jgi:hypothetical protein